VIASHERVAHEQEALRLAMLKEEEGAAAALAAVETPRAVYETPRGERSEERSNAPANASSPASTSPRSEKLSLLEKLGSLTKRKGGAGPSAPSAAPEAPPNGASERMWRL